MDGWTDALTNLTDVTLIRSAQGGEREREREREREKERERQRTPPVDDPCRRRAPRTDNSLSDRQWPRGDYLSAIPSVSKVATTRAFANPDLSAAAYRQTGCREVPPPPPPSPLPRPPAHSPTRPPTRPFARIPARPLKARPAVGALSDALLNLFVENLSTQFIAWRDGARRGAGDAIVRPRFGPCVRNRSGGPPAGGLPATDRRGVTISTRSYINDGRRRRRNVKPTTRGIFGACKYDVFYAPNPRWLICTE